MALFIAIPTPYFYPRSPCGERRLAFQAFMRSMRIFLSTLSLRRATGAYPGVPCGVFISIHALLAESDCITITTTCTALKFLSTLSLRRATYLINTYHRIFGISIHALLAESDLFEYIQAGTGILFLSTLSLRRATLDQIPPRGFHYHFYPRSPCGERLAYPDMIICTNVISIHALLAESDRLLMFS